MVVVHVRVRHMLKAIGHVEIVPAHGQSQVKELNRRVSLIANPVLKLLDGLDGFFTQEFANTR